MWFKVPSETINTADRCDYPRNRDSLTCFAVARLSGAAGSTHIICGLQSAQPRWLIFYNHKLINTKYLISHAFKWSDMSLMWGKTCDVRASGVISPLMSPSHEEGVTGPAIKSANRKLQAHFKQLMSVIVSGPVISISPQSPFLKTKLYTY